MWAEARLAKLNKPSTLTTICLRNPNTSNNDPYLTLISKMLFGGGGGGLLQQMVVNRFYPSPLNLNPTKESQSVEHPTAGAQPHVTSACVELAV